ncbi:MAG: CehA/McbA family metallohydrolase [Planctomycetota bacterium]|nr:CehA/McbA family metallohydrolase [Planctomycetota bacterium]
MNALRLSLPSLVVSCFLAGLHAAELEPVQGVAAQPLKAQVKRVVETLGYLGEPLTAEQQKQFEAAIKEMDDDKAGAAIQAVLDPLCLAGVNINPESRVKVARGHAAAQLNEQGWQVFLVKVDNQAGVTAPLGVQSPNAEPVYARSSNAAAPDLRVKPEDVPNRWMDVQSFDTQPLNKTLSGLELEYRVIQIYSRDRGKREATLKFDVGQGTQDLGFRNELAILFECQAAVKVEVTILDTDGTPTTGQFVVRDSHGQVYPARSRRLAPDFFFHDQVYRHSGEFLVLPPGEYNVTYTRGPEYRILKRDIVVPAAETHREVFQLERWIKLIDHNWYSGDHHVHAAGCAHYDAPTQGVTPEAMMRHILGEDLNVGCVLSWGPCWYFQKQFFEGDVSRLSQPNYLMRYDVEVSGFPSQHAGHLCLLRLKDDDYTYPDEAEFDWAFGPEKGHFKGTRTEHLGEWPTWDLPILAWGKKQGGVVGFSHSGWGLQLPDVMPDGTRQFPEGRWGGASPDWKGRSPDKLPDYAMPRFDGIGANEYVVDVTHGVCDFISSVDTPSVWELNIWYHTLSCGYECRISGETDFPCIYGERVGLGRGYVKLDDQPLTFDNWIQGIKDGRSYCCDGLSHLYDFQVNGLGVGEQGVDGRASVLGAKSGEKLQVKVNAAAFLQEQPREDIRRLRLDQKPYWHVERARVGNTRQVPVELIVNGQSVETKNIDADGGIQSLQFEYPLERSSWVALRIFPSCHTNPIFVEVDGQAIRASKRSAQWCLDAIDVCWSQKEPRTRAEEKDAAAAAYEQARIAYREILAGSFDDIESAK